MLQNYLKVAIRNLRRRFGYSFINVFGLAVGLTCCLLTFLYVRHETSFDRFHEKAHRIYRMANDVRLPSGYMESGATPLPHGPLLDREIPAIEKIGRLFPAPVGLVLEHEGRRFEERQFLFADSTVFDVFSFPLSRGRPDDALAEPFSAVLTQEAAMRYFGEEDPLGKSLVANGEFTFTVTGILRDVPETSHLQFDGLFSLESARSMKAAFFEDRLNLVHATYMLVEPGVEIKALEERANEVVDRHFGEDYRAANIEYTIAFEPLLNVYLRSHRGGLGARGSEQNLWIFSLIAFLTLVIACANFMNLATARSVERAREVGVRRVVGGLRTQVAAQFLTESILMMVPALLLSVLMALAAIPFFNELASTSLSLASLFTPTVAGIVLGGAASVGILAGIYPAFVMSGFLPVSVLKGQHATSHQGVLLRKGLVVFQFTIAIALIAGTAVIHKQVRYMQRQNLGVRSEQMLVIDFHRDQEARRGIAVLKREMREIPGVAGATASSTVPGRSAFQGLAFAEEADGEQREMIVRAFPVDFDFIEEYGIDIAAGRAFSPEYATDTAEAFIINQAAVKELGYSDPEAAIGKYFRQWGREGRIVGVAEDFHATSLRRHIEPLSLMIDQQGARYLTLRLQTNDYPQTVEAVRSTWQRLVPHRPFDYTFLDAAFQKLYDDEGRFGKLVGVASFLAVLVACLGLLGLASFTAVLRTREIGVRKVLGATVTQIVLLLSGDLVRLIVISFVLAVPAIYLLARHWLDEFAYRIDMPWGIFVAAGCAALAAALLTVSYQSIRTATTNPVHALRSE